MKAGFESWWLRSSLQLKHIPALFRGEGEGSDQEQNETPDSAPAWLWVLESPAPQLSRGSGLRGHEWLIHI